MFPWRKMNEQHPCSSCSFTYCTNVALWSSRTFLCTESWLPETYYCFFFLFFLNRHSVQDHLALQHMPSDFISSSSKQTLVSEMAFHFHRCFLSVPHFLLTTWKKKIICPCLVAVAWPNTKAFLNAEMCCVAAVISLYPKGLLLLSFLQLQRVTCLALSTEENSIQSQRGKMWPI